MIETTYSQDGSESKTVISGRRIESSVVHNATQSSSTSEQSSLKIEDTVSHGNDFGKLLLTENAASLIAVSASVETKLEISPTQAKLTSENPLSHDHYVEPTVDYHYAQKKYVDAPNDGKRYVREGQRWVQAPFQDTQLKVQRIVAEITDTDRMVDIPEPYSVPPVVLFNLLEGAGVNLVHTEVDKLHFNGSGKVQIITMGV